MCGAIIGALILGPMAPGQATGVTAAADTKGPVGMLNRAVVRVREASPRAS